MSKDLIDTMCALIGECNLRGIEKTAVTALSMSALAIVSLCFGNLVPALVLVLVYPIIYLTFRIYLWVQEPKKADPLIGEVSFGLTIDGKETSKRA